MKKKSTPPQIENLNQKICESLEKGWFRLTIHALSRKLERLIELPDVLYVLKNGRHEKTKTVFDETFQTWKYSIRGFTLDKDDLRIIIAFDEEAMLIITVIRIQK